MNSILGLKNLLFIIVLLSSYFTYSQSYRFAQKEDIRKKILAKTAQTAMTQSVKKLKGFSYFKLIDTTFEVVLVKNTVADSVVQIDFHKERVEKDLENQLRLIERLKMNLALYPLKKEVFDAEIIDVDKEVLRLYHQLEILNYNRIKVLETKNMNEVDYYKVTFIGDSKNKAGEGMFWYTTLYYYPNGEIVLANFKP
jgi:hypothetical protein